MSLINQVLQDLEKRHASEPELKSLPPHVRAIPEGPRSAHVALFVAAALIVFAIIAAYLFFGGWLRHATSPTVAAVPAPAAPVSAAPAVAELKPALPAPEPVVQLTRLPP